MTTIIVHGTLATHSEWYWNSWHKGGFCNSVEKGMEQNNGSHDVWRINGIPVSKISELETHWKLWSGYRGQISQIDGHFVWSSGDSGIDRDAGAALFARYLNKIREISDEPLRVIAHSHGCNVVKNASSHKSLSNDVFIASAVFLACPHFYSQAYKQKDKFSFKMERAGDQFTYRLDPDRFGNILNLYSEKDSVQVGFAEKIAGQPGPRTIDWGAHESSRIDRDPDTTGLYTNLELEVENECSGLNAHTVMHGQVTGRIAGQWLNGEHSLKSIMHNYGGGLPVISCDDDGE